MRQFPCIIALIGLMTLGLQAQTTYSVPSTTTPTIQSAIDLALSGDTIQIAAGNYAENLVIVGKSITIVGAGANLTVIDANGGIGFSLSIVNPSATRIEALELRAAAPAAIASLPGSDFQLELVDLKLTDNPGAAVDARDATRVLATNCEFANNLTAASTAASVVGVQDDSVIDGCLFSGNGKPIYNAMTSDTCLSSGSAVLPWPDLTVSGLQLRRQLDSRAPSRLHRFDPGADAHHGQRLQRAARHLHVALRPGRPPPSRLPHQRQRELRLPHGDRRCRPDRSHDDRWKPAGPGRSEPEVPHSTLSQPARSADAIPFDDRLGKQS